MGFLFVRYIVIIFLISYSQQLRAEYLTLDSHIDIPFDYIINPEHDPGNDTDMQVDFQKCWKVILMEVSLLFMSVSLN